LQGLEEIIKSPAFGVIVTLSIAVAQFYIISKLGPVKKDVEYLKARAIALEEDSGNQWKELGTINRQLSKLQGEHNALCDKSHRNA